MRPRLYDTDAGRVPVTLELNADLHAKVAAAGLDAAAIAEGALGEALRERIREAIRQEAEVYGRFVEEHGSFSDMVREHYTALVENEAV